MPFKYSVYFGKVETDIWDHGKMFTPLFTDSGSIALILNVAMMIVRIF